MNKIIQYDIFYSSDKNTFINRIKSSNFKIPLSVLDKLVFLKSTVVDKDAEVFKYKLCDIVIKTVDNLLFNIQNYKDIIEKTENGSKVHVDNSTQDSLIIIHIESENRNKLLKYASSIIDMLNEDTNVTSVEVSLDLVTADGYNIVYETRPSMLVKNLIYYATEQGHIGGDIYLNIENEMENYYLPVYLMFASMLEKSGESRIKFKFLNRSIEVLSAIRGAVDYLKSGGTCITVEDAYTFIDELFIADREKNGIIGSR